MGLMIPTLLLGNCIFTDAEPTYTTSNDIQYYRDIITIMTCFHVIVIVSKFQYRPALNHTLSCGCQCC